MTTADTTPSTRLVEFLLQPSSYMEHPHRVELIETHISWVFLTGRHAYKLKKPVRFEFLDFSTAEARRQACEDELRLNKRLAPTVYLDVLPINQDSRGRLSLGGRGTTVDWVVKMRRLRADRTLEALICSGRLRAKEIASVADKLSSFYLQAAPLTIQSVEYRQAIEQRVRANRQELSEPAHGIPRVLVKRVHAAQLRFLKLSPQLFDDRVCDGRVVEGHGDLRPEHIYLTPNTDVIDCVEFNEEFRKLDVVDELCFLAMECERIGGKKVGQRVLESYCDTSGDHPHHMLLAFYKSYRACVRAKVAAFRALQVEPPARQTLRYSIETYLDLADHYAAELGPPVTIVVRGLMGTGKSTLASALADVLGAELLQTDVIRTDLSGESNPVTAYGEGHYCTEDRRRVYDEMFRQAQSLLADRLSVVLDGTFLAADLRIRAFELAQQLGAVPLLVECECPASIAKKRIAERLTSGMSASEARPELFDAQQREEEPDSVGLLSLAIDSTDSIRAQVETVLRQFPSNPTVLTT